MLEGMDTLVFDIQDIGARFYTYISTMGLCMEEAAKHKIRFVVLDRPNPNGGMLVDGPVAEPKYFGVHLLRRAAAGARDDDRRTGAAVQRRVQIHCDLQVVPRRRTGSGDTWWDDDGADVGEPVAEHAESDARRCSTWRSACWRRRTFRSAVGRISRSSSSARPWVDGKVLADALERPPAARAAVRADRRSRRRRASSRTSLARACASP